MSDGQSVHPSMNRRRVMQLLAATAPAAGFAFGCRANPMQQNNPGSQAGLKEVPRERQLILGITGNRLTDFDTYNPFLPGIGTASGYPYNFEPLFLYNAFHEGSTCGPPEMECEEGIIPWLGEGHEFNADFTSVTVNVRDGVKWNDGEAFTANDVAFTFTMLKEHAPKLTWSIDVETWVDKVTADDDLTVTFSLTKPNPRFVFSYLVYHFDIGIPIVPAHIWEAENPEDYTFLDVENNLPVTTSPWKVVVSSAEQRIYDRRDDWWGAETGFLDLPAPERIIVLPGSGESQMVQMAINNELDLSIDLRPNNIQAVLEQNENITTWSGSEPPYGYLDWWPISLGFNDSAPPFNDPEIRWAINHCVDRTQLVELGYKGAGEPTLLPFPNYPALLEFLEPIEDLSSPIDDFDTNKTATIMTAKGYAKDGDGFWAKDGQRLSMVIFTLDLFQDIVPILVEQLRKGGFDASFKQAVGPDFDERVFSGNMDAFILGHGGSVNDPYFTLRLYQSRFSAPTGERATYPYRWENEPFDTLVDEMAVTSPDDPALHDLFRQAMEIWVPELPDIGLVQWMHRIPTNTTYWTNWPSAENPYINTAYWHRTSSLWLHTIQPAQ